jgi:hypothetical protein
MLVCFGVALWLVTELLSLFGAIERVPLAICWLLFVPLLWFGGTGDSLSLGKVRPCPWVVLCAAGVAIIWTLTLVTALFSPPNSADAMAYHMPRVVYWAEQRSIRFFPTPYLNQIMLQPLTEYFMLHTYVLAGSDRFVNLAQWLGSVGSAIGVSSVARLLGANAAGQAIAALFCATIPSGVLAASGAKNDYFLAMWLVAAIYFAMQYARSGTRKNALFLGAALGLALLTKGTAYLFAPWLLAAVLWRAKRTGIAAALGCALLINAPHYIRNWRLSGSVLGFDSAHGDGLFRWRNETFGWKQTFSNLVRNASEQVGGRSERWNNEVYNWTLRAHQKLGIDVNDPATTWRWSTFHPPRNANHEADGNSKWHILLLIIAACVVAWRAARGGDHQPALYALALVCGVLAFCGYLKWQPFLARLFLPLIVAGSPLVSLLLRRMLPAQVLLCLFLFSTARLPLLENWTRPLRGPRSVLHMPREAQYFSDMVQWGDRTTYEKTLAFLDQHPCDIVGIDSTNLSLEYPLMALLRERRPGTLFLHTGVQNASSRFQQPVLASPCIVVCFDCAGDDRRENLYRNFLSRAAIDRFLVFGNW